MQIAVTGASGFVGSNLCPYLQAQGVLVKEVNLRSAFNAGTFARVNCVVHLAGKAHDTQNVSNEKAYFEVNTVLSQRVFDAFLESPARDFIFLSSVKAVADSVEGILTEETVARPSTANGKSKFAAEEYMLSRQLPSGKRLFILRPCMIHGPGNKGNLNLLYKFVAKGIPYPLAAFDNRRSFLTVSNLCFLVHQLLVHPAVESGVYNLADDQPMATKDVVKIIASQLNKHARLWYLPKPFINLAGKIGGLLRLPFNTERIEKLTENFIVSNKKIKAALHIVALPCTAEAGLRKTVECFRLE